MSAIGNTVVGVQGNYIEVPVGAAPLSVTDGTNTVADAAQVTFTGATVGGTSPNATVTVNGTISSPLVLTGQTSTPGAASGTLTNAPAAGNPAIWLEVSVNGTTCYIPAWT